MIAVIGAALIIAAAMIVVYTAAQSWAHRKRTGAQAGDAPKPKIPFVAVVLAGLGALLVAIAASFGPSAPP